MFYHEPVLLDSSIKALIQDKNGVFVDGTLGGGGHFKAITQELTENGTVIGIDRDRDAIERNKKMTTGLQCSTILHHGRFSTIPSIVQELGFDKIDGLLLDLGVSSHQIDTESRGFSYKNDAPLDMRMNQHDGKTAQEFIAESSERELSEILREYGELKSASRIARALKKGSSNSSGVLQEQLRSEFGKDFGYKTLSKIFQALRIAVNEELQELQTILEKIIPILKRAGRIVVISYHSLEDRIVKQFFRVSEQSCVCPPTVHICQCDKVAVLKRITRKAVKPSELEIQSNPRARSARLRVAEKV